MNIQKINGGIEEKEVGGEWCSGKLIMEGIFFYFYFFFLSLWYCGGGRSHQILLANRNSNRSVRKERRNEMERKINKNGGLVKAERLPPILPFSIQFHFNAIYLSNQVFPSSSVHPQQPTHY